jgi:UDP-GlcNAc3NAcA epimerase
MSKKRILTIVGARPQFIKASVVSRAILSIPEFEEKILHTGQHFDANMSDLFFEELSIPKPYKNLNVANNGLHGEHTAKMLTLIEREAIKIKPDIGLIYGDTNSTLAAALAVSKLGIPVAHVEAGTRCLNRSVPEELNRIVTDHLSSLLFCSTDESKENLESEGIKKNVYRVGDVMIDSIFMFKDLAMQVESAFVPDGEYFLLTLHREENTTNPIVLKKMMKAFSKSTKEIIFPIHPRTKNIIQKNDINVPEVITMIEPQGYLEMIRLLEKTSAVFTDSGGLQKEAVAMQKRCFTLREETEWMETVREGWNILLGNDPDKIESALVEADRPFSKSPFPTENYFGDGHASFKIANHLLEFVR